MVYSENRVFKIGDIELGLFVGLDWEFTNQRRFPDFSTKNSPQVNYQVSLYPVGGKPAGSLIFDSGQLWRLYADGDRRIIWVGTRDFSPRLIGNFSSNYRSGEIITSQSTIEEGKYIFPLSYPLGEVLMTNLLGTGYGLMVHSCGVVDGENGIVFAGVGSAGKTTTAKLWSNTPGGRVLNDDHTIIRKIDHQFRVYGTPWHGQGGFALAEDAPVQKIFILEHAKSNHAERLSPAQAAAALLVRSFAPLWDASAMAFTLRFLDDMCQAVPCYKLGFLPDQSAVEYVRCLSKS
jgi:hypothetical protein